MATADPVSEEFTIDVREVARRLEMSPETIRRWARQGKIPSLGFGQILRFEWEKVKAALERKAVTGG